MLLIAHQVMARAWRSGPFLASEHYDFAYHPVTVSTSSSNEPSAGALVGDVAPPLGDTAADVDAFRGTLVRALNRLAQ